MKKSILFVIDSLDIAGAEKSLISLLSMLDYSTYTVDLQLFAYGHALEPFIPEEVHVLPPLKYTQFTQLNFRSALKEAVVNKQHDLLVSRLTYSATIRLKNYNNPQKAILYWKHVQNVIENNPKTYDIAISYAQGVPTYYVADKVRAKRKLAWVNVSYDPDDKVKQFQRKYYGKFDQIVTVSHSTKAVFTKHFPTLKEKVAVLYDITNPELIMQMAELDSGFTDDFNGIRILTVGRLAHQKGYDLALEACEQLKKDGVHFKWYAIGKGPLEEEIKKRLKEKGLEQYFMLLGSKVNPYPYYKQADLYVQTSRFEGFGLAIAEARFFNVPVVTTEFDAVYNQIVHRKNGLVVQQNGKSISQAIQQLIVDKKLNESIVANLRKEKKGNVENIETFYQLIH